MIVMILNLNFMIRVPSMNLNTTSVGQVFRPFRSAQLLFLLWPLPAVKLGGSEDFAGYQIPNSRALGVVSRLLPPSPCMRRVPRTLEPCLPLCLPRCLPPGSQQQKGVWFQSLRSRVRDPSYMRRVPARCWEAGNLVSQLSLRCIHLFFSCLPLCPRCGSQMLSHSCIPGFLHLFCSCLQLVSHVVSRMLSPRCGLPCVSHLFPRCLKDLVPQLFPNCPAVVSKLPAVSQM